jgi:hypothetical protein
MLIYVALDWVIDLTFRNMIETVPIDKRGLLSEKLANVVLSTKNDDKMPSELANAILYYWQRNLLLVEPGLTALLEAAALLETEKTTTALTELGLTEIAERVKQTSAKAEK